MNLSRKEPNFSGFKTRARYLCVNSVKGLEQHCDPAGKLSVYLTLLRSNNMKPSLTLDAAVLPRVSKVQSFLPTLHVPPTPLLGSVVELF